MRLVDIDSLRVISFIGKSQDFIDGAAMVFDMVHALPTVEVGSCVLDEETSNALMDIISKGVDLDDRPIGGFHDD